MNKYQVVIDWSDEDDGFVARVPALKYCTAFGDTYEEAVQEIQVAIDGWLETAREKKIPIPAPGPTVAELSGVASILNVKEIARLIGVPAQTLYAKVRRGSELSVKESTKVARALAARGVHLVPRP